MYTSNNFYPEIGEFNWGCKNLQLIDNRPFSINCGEVITQEKLRSLVNVSYNDFGEDKTEPVNPKHKLELSINKKSISPEEFSKMAPMTEVIRIIVIQ